jgi:hypothetical protein
VQSPALLAAPVKKIKMVNFTLCAFCDTTEFFKKAQTNEFCHWSAGELKEMVFAKSLRQQSLGKPQLQLRG